MSIQPVSTNCLPQTLLGAVRYFTDGDTCFNFLVSVRWPDGVTCLRCQGAEHSFLTTRKLWKCKACKYQFSIKVGTIFENSPLGFDKWLPCIWLIANAKNGISSCEVSRAIGVTQATAWHMLHRIRLAMQMDGFKKFVGKFTGTVEADETYIGGKEKNKHAKKKLRKGRGSVGKTIVFGMLRRAAKDGEVSQARMFVVTNTSRQTLHARISENVTQGSEVFTDSLPAYKGLVGVYNHAIVDHTTGQYVGGRTGAASLIHTNGIENVWSVTKRGLKGTYISVEAFHLFRYLDEADFRFNSRRDTDAERFLKALTGAAGKTLPYAELTETYLTYYDTLAW